MVTANFFHPHESHPAGVNHVDLAIFRFLCDIGDPNFIVAEVDAGMDSKHAGAKVEGCFVCGASWG